MSGPAPTHPGYGIVVPAKPLALAKSRLAPLGEELRRELATAFLVDTVTAALQCREVRRVLVVTDELDLALALEEAGATAVPDGCSGDLNGSLAQGAAELLRRSPDLRPVALCGDLPALRPEELSRTLERVRQGATHRTAFLPDMAGTGTTLFSAPDLTRFAPAFGFASRAGHAEAGAVELPVEGVDSVRSDVDTPEDLRSALGLGVGPRTAWVVARAGLRGSRAPAPRR